MEADEFRSLSNEATFAGQAKPARQAEVSLGGERTIGGDHSTQETVIDDIEAVDLESRYKVEGSLGQGGMGAVVLATDTRLGRKVAIKRILGEASRSRTAVMRFLTEAKAIATLNHPNIVQIYDYGRAKDGPFLIMEHVSGGSLAERCRKGAIPLHEAVDLACQLCDGLAKAHDADIIHRDIKPANVLLNEDGVPKLTDFGLAKAESQDQGVTMAGAVMGTPDFMPPEQRQDPAFVDHRSDLWSLAATVYQMVTGRSPKIIRFKDVPDALHDVLGKALEEDKSARYQSAREFRDALRGTIGVAIPVTLDDVPGQCPECGLANEISRKFCAKCGTSLRALCLSCKASVGTWEQICGECGGKQPELLDSISTKLRNLQATAEKLLEEHRYDDSLAALTEPPPEDARFKEFATWKVLFEERVRKVRNEELARVSRLIAEAIQHERAHDYQSAVNTLEKVPAPLRGIRSTDGEISAAELLARVSDKQAEVSRLDTLIRQRISDRQIQGLLPHVVRLHELKPGRADLARIKRELEERDRARVAAQVLTITERAQALMNVGQHRAAVDMLHKSGLAMQNTAIAALIATAITLDKLEQDRLNFFTLKPAVEYALRKQRFGTVRRLIEVFISNATPETQWSAEAQKMMDDCIQARNRVKRGSYAWMATVFLFYLCGGLLCFYWASGISWFVVVLLFILWLGATYDVILPIELRIKQYDS